ncbi:vacuolar assembling protein VPS41 [Schizopora paradoxa]|uniref:Vacuolar protein sorting-associated protein 41 n=1 Tax=Schizopora paradoxa TaxID=27342 RepID=A0A0H2RMC3_9AGAM|nr:vacuolar assembling protein VPS41 [Schizopora paradoxa]
MASAGDHVEVGDASEHESEHTSNLKDTETNGGTNGVNTEHIANGGLQEPAHEEHDESDDVHEDGEEEVSEDESASESGSEEEDEDEDEEPALKYDLLGGSTASLLQKDSASALAVCSKFVAMGTHAGIVHALDFEGNRVKSFRPHSASIIDLCVDSTGDFVATASMDGQVVIHSLSTPESYAFDMKRPMRTVALDPNFAKNTTRAFVCGGMAGNLVMHEKGWLGHKENVLHSGEGPIWMARWRGNLIAWANDMGVKIYDMESQTRITFIDRPADSPRADLFKCTLHWQDDSTLLIAWADVIKVARVRSRPRIQTKQQSAEKILPPLMAEITALFGIEGMISGIVPYPTDPLQTASAAALTSFLVLAYTPPDTSFKDEAVVDRRQQARKLAERPELRIISRSGEELSSDVLDVPDFQTCGCNDYFLCEVPSEGETSKSYVVLNPRTIIIVKPRDRKDHITWLVERKRYEEALEQVELLEGHELNVVEIGEKYIDHLIAEGDFDKAAHMCPRVLGQDTQRWENWIFLFAQKQQLNAIIPYTPVETPRLTRLVYEMILAYFLANDRPALLRTVREWPTSNYDIAAVIVLIQSELSNIPPSSADASILMDCLVELFVANRQPGKALPYMLRLRRPNVFDLIRTNNLFTDVQDQALLLVEFDQEIVKKRQNAGENVEGTSPAIALLVDHTYSIPVARVVQQLQERPYFLFLYLDALFHKDPHLATEFADSQVTLYAEFAQPRLIDFLRASNYYSLEKAYKVCKERDYVPEMVFLLGRMGNNRAALSLIIDRLGDVERAIDFAKEQNDEDLWEDLLRYSETRPAFIRGLLENVGPEINPIRLIRRIKNGLEIPGLKEALIKILQAFNLQISLLEGCQTILEGDCATLARALHKNQNRGFFGTVGSTCPICSLPLHQDPDSITVLFLCRHVVHLTCVSGGEGLTRQPDAVLASLQGITTDFAGKIAFAASIRRRISQGCPVCHKRDEGNRT